MPTPGNRFSESWRKARAELLAERGTDGYWTGELSSSALSTATAVVALALMSREFPGSSRRDELISRGLEWLATHCNQDGGWGDTVLSVSNISTTTLVWCAFGCVSGADTRYPSVVSAAEGWLKNRAGSLDPGTLAEAIIQRYGKDRTFSVPILTTCAVSGRFGSGPGAWRRVIPLPFELAAVPHRFFAALKLPVVSYALPALIAIGQVRHHHSPSWNPFARAIRGGTRGITLKKLRDIQPASGGFLEATPLTSFVALSLVASGQAQNEVTQRAIEFLVASARPDGSWPIDTNLATWVTTLSVNALSGNASLPIDSQGRDAIRSWLLGQHYRKVHRIHTLPPVDGPGQISAAACQTRMIPPAR